MKPIVGRLFGLVMWMLALALPGMAQLTIGDLTLPTATRTGAYGPFQFTATAPGGIIYTWNVDAASGQPPAGVTLSASGVLSATNISGVAGTYPFVVRATCASGCSGNPTNTKNFSITVVDPPLFSANASSLPPGINNVPYSQNITSFFNASGGVPPYTYLAYFTEGSPVIGLDIVSSPVYSGIPNASPQTYLMPFRLRDANGALATAIVELPLTITTSAATLSPSQLQNWTINRPYLREIRAQLGQGAYTYQISGALANLGLKSDAKLACPSEAPFETATLYSAPLNLTGGPSGPVVFSASNLPSGYSVNPSTGVVSGFLDGSFSNQVQFRATYSDGFSVGRTCSMVSQLSSGASAFASCPLDYAVTNSPYFSGISLIGTSSSSSFILSGSSLPPGLSLDSSTGSITGTATQAGLYAFTVNAGSPPFTQNLNCSIRVLDAASSPQGGSFIYGVPTATGTVSLSATLLNQVNPPVANYSLTINPAPAINSFTYPIAATGGSYSSNLLPSNLSGGTPSFSYALASGSGPLPPGLSLGSDGSISGTPTQVGTFSFNLQVTDVAGAVATASRQIVVSNAPTFSPATLTGGIVNVSYSVTLSGAGGSGSPYTFTNPGGGLPPGLALASNGLLNGTPTQAGTFSFNVRVSDSTGLSGTFQRQIVIAGGLTMAPSSLSLGVQGVAYAATFTASGGSGSGYSFTVADGILPPGLSLASSGGLSGTPTQTGTFSFTVRVADAQSNSLLRNYILRVVSITCPSVLLPLGAPYSSSLSVSGLQVNSYSVNSGGLPPGIQLNSSNGTVSGTATAEGLFSPTFTATDVELGAASRSCPLNVSNSLLLSSPRTTARLGQRYSSSLSVVGGRAPYLFQLVSGALPQGLSLDSVTGRITGLPAVVSTNLFGVTVTDSDGRKLQRSFTIYVIPRPGVPNLRCPVSSAALDASYLSHASVNANLDLRFFAIGNLPPGITLSITTGQFSGVPTTPGSYTFQLAAAQPSSPPQVYGESQCRIDVAPEIAPLNLTCNDQDDLVVSEIYASPALPAGGIAPITIQLEESLLPPGLTLNSSTGLISGVPSSAGTYNYTLRARDAANSTRTASCSVLVSPPPAISITPPSLPEAETDSAYTVQLSAPGATPPLTWSLLSGTLPNGLAFNTSSGLISGTPTNIGQFNFLVGVSDALQRFVSRPLSISVTTPVQPLYISTRTLGFGTVGIPYQNSVGAGGGSPGYTFSLAGGALPPGLSLASNGAISGTPTTVGAQFAFTVRVTDRAGATAEASYTVSIFPGELRMSCPSAPAEVGAFYEAAASVLGGTSPYSFSLALGALPAGLELNAGSGLVSGRPTSPGLASFTLAVTDSRQAKTQILCSINVRAGQLRITSEDNFRATPGQVYRGSVEAAGGQGPYAFTLPLGSLPPGLNFSASGAITGTPTKSGSYPFTAEVRDATGATVRKAFTFVVAASNLSLTCPANLSPAYSFPYSDTFATTGGLAPLQFIVTNGSIPPGLSLGTPNAEGLIPLTGSATLPGEYPVVVRATDSSDTAVSLTCRFRVTGELLQITTASLGQGRQFAAYSEGLAARGGVGAYRWSVSSGSLPEGLQLDPVSGSIGGRPLRAGTFGFTAQVTDSRNNRASRGFEIVMSEGQLPLIITTESPLSDANVGRPYSAGFSVEGGKPPYVLSAEGVPEGFSFAGGSLSGTPQAAGTADLTVTARDANNETTSKGFSFRIKGQGSLRILSANVPDGVEGESYSGGFTAEGGTAPLLWSIVSGGVPAGVIFDSSSGRLSGRPTVSGPFTLTVDVADARGDSARAGVEYAIRPAGVTPLEITTATLPDANIAAPYSLTLGARGGREPYTWSIQGDLLEGLSFNASGQISGNAQRVGTTTFNATVRDALGFRASRSFTLRASAGAPPALLIEGLPDSTTPNQTLPFTLRLASPFSVAVRGRLTLVFVPDAIHGADDNAVRFGNSTRSIDFIIAANSTQTIFSAGALTLASGTLAGTIRVDSSLEFGGVTAAGPSRSISLARRAPVISNITITRSGNSLSLRIEGFTTSRRLNEARVTLTPAAGVDLTGNALVTVNVQAAIQAWFASSAASQFGGQFALVLPFTVDGAATNITGVSVVIVNDDGTSNTVTAN